MRIIAGSLKGRRLAAPRWAGLRPTSDKLRETLFNVIARRVPGASVLDGFAGTGALGIEALSRGAARVTFVEQDPRAVSLIRENLARCEIAEGYAIIRAAVDRASRRLPNASFDIILLDPPYALLNDEAEEDGAAAIAAVAALLAPGGLLVLEHARRRPAPDSVGALICTRRLASGDSALALYEPT